MKYFENNNCYFIVGNNANENWKLLEERYENDVWIHLKHLTSPHVFVCLKNMLDDVSNDDILYGCTLCKQFSKYKNGKKKLQFNYTETKNVEKGRSVGSVVILSPPKVMTI